jgi:hypothetical protein
MAHHRRFAALLSALAILTACTAEAGAGPVPAEDTAAQLVLPFDHYRLGFDDEVRTKQARNVLIGRCLHALGLGLTLPGVTTVPGALDVSPNARRYGVLDDATAARYGYHFPKTPEEVKSARDLQDWSSKLSAEQSEALYGKGGCADQAIPGEVPDDDFLTSQDFGSLDESAKSPDVVRAKAAWQQCMSARGFQYADPKAAISDPRWNLDSAAIPRLESETARADVACKESSRLVSVWHDLEVTLQRQSIEHDAERFGRLEASVRAELSNARRILAG